MRFFYFARGPGGQVYGTMHAFLRIVREGVEGAAGTVVVDLLQDSVRQDGSFVESLLPGQGPARGPRALERGPVLASGRAFWHLNATERRGARRLARTLPDGCPLFQLRGGLDVPAAVLAAGGGTHADAGARVVERLLFADPFEPPGALPGPLARALDARKLRGVADLLTRDEAFLLALPGAGKRDLPGLRAWAERRTEALGMRMDLDAVRERLRVTRRGGPPELTARLVEALPEAARALDVRSVPWFDPVLRRALVAQGIATVGRLADFPEATMLRWFGFGPALLARLQRALEDLGAPSGAPPARGAAARRGSGG